MIERIGGEEGKRKVQAQKEAREGFQHKAQPCSETVPYERA